MKDYKWIVFCDFDGTITEDETIEMFFQKFHKEEIRVLAERIIKNGYTIKEGIRKLAFSVPSSEYYTSINELENARIRSGFEEFLPHLKSRNIDFVLISGGLRDMIEVILKDFINDLPHIFSAEPFLENEYLTLLSHYESSEELVSKVEIMKKFTYDKCICIGDSYTDIIMAQNSDLIFARDRLASFLKKENIKYYAYETFYDIMKVLNDLEI